MPEKKTNRRVKNPETFRERAMKSAADSDKPSKRRRLSRAIAWPLVKIFAAGASIFGTIGSIQPFRTVFRVVKIVGRVLVPRFLRNSWKELRQVKWPSWKQSRDLTFAVLLFAVVFGLYVSVLDYGLNKVFKFLLLK